MPAIASLTARSRSTGSARWIGSGAISCVMRLPSEPSCSGARVETGTQAFISSPSVRMPRLCSQSRSAPATTASTTSLTVPPNASLTSLKSSSCAGAIAIRRCGRDRDVERRVGRRAHARAGDLGRARRASRAPGRARSRGCAARAAARSGRPSVAAGRARERRGGELGVARLGLRHPDVGAVVGARRRAGGRRASSSRSTPLTPSTSA